VVGTNLACRPVAIEPAKLGNMPSERLEEIRHQLEAIAEELADMAMASLRGALEGGEELRSGFGEEASVGRARRAGGAPAAVRGTGAAAEERLLTNARRAVLKAANLLAASAGAR
jgi:hypothetical protein